MLFPAGGKVESDYHKNMYGDVIMRGIERRLVPGLRAGYLGGEMVPILDHDPHHHGMAQD